MARRRIPPRVRFVLSLVSAIVDGILLIGVFVGHLVDPQRFTTNGVVVTLLISAAGILGAYVYLRPHLHRRR